MAPDVCPGSGALLALLAGGVLARSSVAGQVGHPLTAPRAGVVEERLGLGVGERSGRQQRARVSPQPPARRKIRSVVM
eukprot:2814145-Pyramimonas_sp.AAC.1